MQLFRTGATNTGDGVFAFVDIPKGTHLITMTGVRMQSRAVEEAIEQGKIKLDDPFQIGEDTFLALARQPRLFNHSCEPNAGFKKGIHMVALRDIKAGEQICYDYSAVVCTHCEWSMLCLCKSKTCRKKIGNVETLPKMILENYKKLHLLPRFILKEVRV